MAVKNIIIRCHLYDCYWNIGQKFLRGGNCSHKKITITVDCGLCDQYIERGEAQAKLAQAAFRNIKAKGEQADD